MNRLLKGDMLLGFYVSPLENTSFEQEHHCQRFLPCPRYQGFTSDSFCLNSFKRRFQNPARFSKGSRMPFFPSILISCLFVSTLLLFFPSTLTLHHNRLDLYTTSLDDER
jgi:hypothetical protein